MATNKIFAIPTGFAAGLATMHELLFEGSVEYRCLHVSALMESAMAGERPFPDAHDWFNNFRARGCRLLLEHQGGGWPSRTISWKTDDFFVRLREEYNRSFEEEWYVIHLEVQGLGDPEACYEKAKRHYKRPDARSPNLF